MSEQNFRAIGATTFLSPVPAVMLSCRGSEPGHERPNLITVAWTGIVNSDPPMLSVSIRPERFSHALIRESGAFCLNLIDNSLSVYNAISVWDMCCHLVHQPFR